MKNVFILILFVLAGKVSICQVSPVGTPYPINQNLGRSASTLVSTNNIRFDQGMILGHFTDTTVANALPYLKNYPYTIISVDTNIVYMRNWNATKWMYMPVEGQVVNGDTIHYLIRVNRRPGSDSVFGKYYNGVTTFESFQFIDSTGPGNTGWRITGNAGTSPGTNFIGTTDGQGLMFKVSNIQSGFIDLLLSNTSFGFRSLTNDVGGDNTAFGFNSLRANTDGFRNTAVGNSALDGNTVGQENVAVGHQAMALGQEGTFNTAIGPYSLYNNTTGYSNAGLGKNSGLANTTGFQNAFVGAGAGEANTTGQENTMVGYDAGLNNTTGIRNVHVGWNAKSGTNGGNNVMIGYRTGASLTAGNTTNVFVGSQSGDNASQKVDATNSIAIGQGTFTTANNQTVIGNTSNTQFIFNGALMPASLPGSSGQLLLSQGSNTSPIWSGSLPSGLIPTWQQTLTAGSTLDAVDNNITGSEPLSFSITSGGRSGAITLDGGQSILSTSLSGRTSNFYLSGDTIFAKPGLGLYYIDTLTNAPGTRALRYNPTTGLVSYADTSSGGGVALSAITAATGTNSIDNGNFAQDWEWGTLAGQGLHLQTGSTAASGNAQVLLDIEMLGANANASQTTRAVAVSNAHTGTGSTNIGIDLSVSGGATANYGARSNAQIRFTHDGTGIQWDNGGYFTSSGGTGQTTVGMAPGSGAAIIFTSTDVYGQTGGAARWRTVANGTFFGNAVSSAHSQLQTGGSFAGNYTTTATNLTLDITHWTVNVSAAATITLPTAAGIQGREYTIVNSHSANITLNTTSSQTIGLNTSATSVSIASDGGITVVSDNANWKIKSQF